MSSSSHEFHLIQEWLNFHFILGEKKSHSWENFLPLQIEQTTTCSICQQIRNFEFTETFVSEFKDIWAELICFMRALKCPFHRGWQAISSLHSCVCRKPSAFWYSFKYKVFTAQSKSDFLQAFLFWEGQDYVRWY